MIGKVVLVQVAAPAEETIVGAGAAFTVIVQVRPLGAAVQFTAATARVTVFVKVTGKVVNVPVPLAAIVSGTWYDPAPFRLYVI